jgi:hypothetical protein
MKKTNETLFGDKYIWWKTCVGLNMVPFVVSDPITNPCIKTRMPPKVVKHTISVQAGTIIASYTTITAGVNDGNAHQTKLGVLGALASIIGGRSVGFILAVGCGDDVGGFECPAVGGCRCQEVSGERFLDTCE